MMKRERKHGQVAIFLVLILAGLALLFALNIDVFVSSRAKIRLQNAADASGGKGTPSMFSISIDTDSGPQPLFARLPKPFFGEGKGTCS